MYFRLPSKKGHSTEEASDLALFLVVSCAYLCVPASGEARISELAVIILFFVCALFFQQRLRSVSGWTWSALILAGLFYSLFSAFLAGGGFEAYFHGLLKFLILVTFIQYFNRRKKRDELVVILLSLLLVSATTILTISMSFLVLLIAFVGLVITFLMILSVEDAARKFEDRERALLEKEKGASLREMEPPSSYRLPPRFYRLPWMSTLVILLVGAVIFVVVPRVGRGFFAWRTSLHSRVTGYSEEVNLGSVGDIMKSESMVMRVKLEGVTEGTGPFYFRGNALDFYTGRGWRDSRGALKFYYFGRSQTMSFEEIGSLDDVIKQEIILEPIDSNILFAIPELKTISRPQRFRSLLIYRNGYLGLPHGGSINDRINYTAWSEPSPQGRTACEKKYEGAGGLEVRGVMNKYLQLPSGMERTRNLAAEVTAGENTVCGKIFALREFFHEEFEYDLDTPSERAEDPMSDFLFNSRRGYCEYFSTAMALMLRSEGIPCRLAAGYLAEDYNPVEKYYRVRQKNAHTWVEVFLPGGRDWLLVDPTPIGGGDASGFSTVQWLQDIKDAVQYRWDRYVVDLSLNDQYMMALQARDSTERAGRFLARLPAYFAETGRFLVSTGVALYLIAVVALGVIVWMLSARKKRGSRGRNTETDALKKEYAKLLHALSKKGIKRGLPETPLELAARVEKNGGPYAAKFRKATELYLMVRFGGRGSKDEAFSAISEAIAGIRRPS